MKKIILLMLLVIPMSIYAQKYVPFPTENAQWNIKSITKMYPPPVDDSTLLRYSLQGDTIINGTNYHKIVKNTGTGANNLHKGVGGIREQDRKIYYLGESYAGAYYYSVHEVMLYDFTKQEGDTVWLDRLNRLYYTISKIDSVKIGNEYRKRYTTERFGSTEYIIEGIGNVNSGLLGIITPIPTCMECHIEWEFTCFSQNGELVYKNPAYINCNSMRKWSDIPYVPFPTGNARWSEIFISESNTSGYPRQHKMIGDTTINSRLYHKIYMQDDTLKSNTTAYYVGALREQSKKIYFWSKYENNEMRLYDFSKNVGDTIQKVPFQQLESLPGTFSTIMKIDSMYIDGSYRKIYYLDKINNSHIWIEGIGSTYGLLVPRYEQPTCYCVLDLLCFHQNDSVKYLNPIYNRCFPSTIDGVGIPIKKISVTVSPNPILETSIIKWDISENNSFSTLVITDILGKSIKTMNVLGKSEVSINRSDFTQGIYFVRLFTKNGDGNRVIKIVIE